MELQKFIKLREFLYHLTDDENVDAILANRKIDSAETLARTAEVLDVETFLRTRRVGHHAISKGNFKAKLRDQDPLFRNIVIKNLEGGWTFEDFVFSLNSRVFFWAKENDLRIHYKRYENQNEYPKIIRMKTSDLFEKNNHSPQFCRLNSGAPRCSAYYDEGAPPRGASTFLAAEFYPGTPSSVREVTFPGHCCLPDLVWLSDHPDNPYIEQ